MPELLNRAESILSGNLHDKVRQCVIIINIIKAFIYFISNNVRVECFVCIRDLIPCAVLLINVLSYRKKTVC